MAAIPDTMTEPFPIFKLAHHYLLYDIEIVSYIRKTYNVCGVLVGTLPQSPQQNVFQGLPLELMPEEARLLVEKEVAYLVDDSTTHKRTFLADGLSAEEKRAYQSALRRQGASAAKEVTRKKAEEKTAALRRKSKSSSENWNDVPDNMLNNTTKRDKYSEDSGYGTMPDEEPREADGKIFDSIPGTTTTPNDDSSRSSGQEPEPYYVTPTTSTPPLQISQPSPKASTSLRFLPEIPSSYPLFAHMHSNNYFLTPGLRFGCQYMAYPGDPLRFHSHFLCNGMEWDQEFDLMDLVGGGRLGTGVKKGFLIGGKVEGEDEDDRSRIDGVEEGEGKEVRAFCVEWAGM